MAARSTLWIGAILCGKQRTVASVLRILGLGQESGFDNYHHVLSGAKWSSLQAGKILLGLLIALIPPNAYIIISIDGTFERRKGKKIFQKGSYRDPVRSSQKHVVYCFSIIGCRWRFCQYLFGHICIQCGWALVSKLRLDAQLYNFPPPKAPHKRGPKPQKGNKLTPLKNRIEEACQNGTEVTVKWYGGKRRRVCYLSGVCLWYTPAQTPVKIRWVLVVDPQGRLRSEAFFSTHVELSPVQIIETYVLRWNEAPAIRGEESRAHLGIETQRQWSPKAIQKTTPALLALFSIVTLFALKLSRPKNFSFRKPPGIKRRTLPSQTS